MATLATFRTNVTSILGLDNTASSAEQSLVDGWLNEGVVQFLLDTRCYVKSATMTLTAGTNDYTLDTGILHTVDVYVSSGGSDYPLTQLSVQELLHLRRAEGNIDDSPVRYYAIAGSNLFMVYPTPDSADTVTVYYVPRPTAMSSAAHDPSNATYGGVPTEFHPAIEFYALWRGADYDDDQSSAQGQRYRDLYDQFVKRAKKHVALKGNARLPRARVGRRRYVPRDPSVDTRW